MYNPNFKKNKRILFLFLITTTISLFTFSQIFWNTNSFSPLTKSYTEFDSENGLKTSDYSSNFGNTGENMNITLHQSLLNTTLREFTNLGSLNSFTENFPDFNGYSSSFINVTIEDIFAPWIRPRYVKGISKTLNNNCKSA